MYQHYSVSAASSDSFLNTLVKLKLVANEEIHDECGLADWYFQQECSALLLAGNGRRHVDENGV
jgi:hypothetical protein